MYPRPSLFLLGLVTSLAVLTAACATRREHAPAEEKRAEVAGVASARVDEAPEDGRRPASPDLQARALPVGLRELEDGSLKVLLPPRPFPPAFDFMRLEEARSLREALSLTRDTPRPHLRLVETPGPRRRLHPASAQVGLWAREAFLSGFGPGPLPLPDAVDDSPLLAALRMSPRFMGEGFQQAAEELFNSPLFIHGVYLSVMLYFSAWLAPEPFFSKGLAAALTVRLALLVGLVESAVSSALSTHYGPPHTRSNPPHNEAIEEELAAREGAGHIRLDKNKAQTNAANRRVFDPAPAKGVRFRRPDASSVRPDGVRHNTNYISNPGDMRRELEAFEAMIRADPRAIHELYRLDGTLVRRYVPPGVGFP